MRLEVHFKPWLVPLIIFALALLVRVSMLGAFVTADEPFWIESSRWFTAGLFLPDLECPAVKNGRPIPARGWGCTLQSGHPGVTTMWGGSLGLVAYYWQAIRPTGVSWLTFLQTRLSDHLDPTLVTWVRLPLAVLSAVFIMIFYILLRRLLTAQVAVVATLLLALHPFHIALSRVLHHDALNTTFMLLSVLAMIGYWLRGWRWYWLLFSAAMAGFAFLGKPISWLLLPYAVTVGGLSLFYRSPSSVWRLLGEGIWWGGLAWLAFVIFFPAMWVTPKQVIAVIFEQNVQLAGRGHSHYFLGQVSDDPGLLFYPIGWLWQASPLEIIGLLVLPVIAARFISSKRTIDRPIELALILFLLILLLLETAADKKMLRYFLPAFPVIAIFAAYGLIWLVDSFTLLFLKKRTHWVMPLLISLVVLIQGGLAFGHFPYYFTYYNPLLGGPPVASRLMTVGWGEGLEQAAHYLNQLPNAESLAVSSWYSDIFHPYFVGQRASFSDDGRAQLAADYVVFYVNQIQRQKPYPGLVNYFRADEPVFVVEVEPAGRVSHWFNPDNSGDKARWVEVYKSPAAQSAGGAPEIEGVARLLAYKVAGSRIAGSQAAGGRSEPLSENDLSVTLFLRVLGPLPEGTTFDVALIPISAIRNPQSAIRNQLGWQPAEIKGQWLAGNVVEWPGVLILPPDMSPGEYRLWVAFQFEDGQVIAEFPISEEDPPLRVE